MWCVLLLCVILLVSMSVFFFRRETAYEMRMSDWSSDVCSSDLATTGSFDLILLDVMLPGKGGFDVCRDVRQHGTTTPILMLTARGQTIDKVLDRKSVV